MIHPKSKAEGLGNGGSVLRKGEMLMRQEERRRNNSSSLFTAGPPRGPSASRSPTCALYSTTAAVRSLFARDFSWSATYREWRGSGSSSCPSPRRAGCGPGTLPRQRQASYGSASIRQSVRLARLLHPYVDASLTQSGRSGGARRRHRWQRQCARR